MAEAVAQARPWKQGPHTLGSAVKAISENPSDPIGRLLLGCHALKRLIRLGKGCHTGVLGIPQMPEHTTTDNRGQIHLVGETVTMLLIGEEIGGERQATPGQHGDQTLVAERTDQAIEGHRRDK